MTARVVVEAMIEKMPSASTKTEKVPNSEASEPLRQAIIIIEHKIRNLEKRKARLDLYKESEKALTKEQAEAVSKYEEVMQQLELSREYVKQFTTLCIDTDKMRKKNARKEALERTTTETAKIKQVLLIQDVLQNLGSDQVREDFLNGTNGAVTLTDADLKCLDDLYVELSPKHEGPVPFATQVQKAAEHMMTIIEGRTRELAGSTGIKIQGLVTSIHASGYFEQQEKVPEEEPAAEEQPQQPEVPEVAPEAQEPLAPAEEVPQYIVEQTPLQQPKPNNIPNAAGIHTIMQNIVPVSQVESTIFNAQGFQPPNTNNANNIVPQSVQPVQQPAPLNDVMSRVGGNFTFFQESELDAAATLPQPPSAIPTRTFTNQTFNGQPAQTYQPGPPNDPYFVAGYQALGGAHYTPEMIQGYPGTLPTAPPVSQPPATDAPNRGFPQPPQHLGNNFVAANNVEASGPPPASAPSTTNQTYQMDPIPPAPSEESPKNISEEKKEETPTTDWVTNDRLEWGNEEFAEWAPQGTNGTSNSGGGKGRDRNDRPRSNYQGNRNRNSNNYNRSGNRDRDSGSNYNQQNGYQSRGDYNQRDNGNRDRDYQPRDRDYNNKDRDYQSRDNNKDRDYHSRDNKDRDYQPRGDRETNGGYGGYRRGPPASRGPRPDRPDRQDRPQYNNSGPRNSGPRPPRNNYRGNNGNYKQEAQEAK